MPTALEAAIRALVNALLVMSCAQPLPVTPPVVVPPVPAVGGLVQQSDLTYVGAFKLPRLSDLQYADTSLVYHSGRILVQGHDGKTFYDLEVVAPATGPYAALPEAILRMTFADSDLGGSQRPSNTLVRGLLFDGLKLILSVSDFYDALGAQKVSHLSRDLTSGTVSAFTFAPVGHTAGFMTASTGELGPALTGNFGLPIITRESWGPAAFIFDPQDLTKPAIAVLDYPDAAHSVAGDWNVKSDVWNGDSKFGGMAMVGRSVLFFGVHGTGPFCYGPDASVAGKWVYVNAPCNAVPHETTDKGTHADPYVYRIWAYDANDLIAVKQGKLKPWEPKPYGVWNLTLPYSSGRHRAAWTVDPQTNRVFVLQGFSDQDVAQGWPVIHVLHLGP